ncbi:MAG: YihY/virulence factor BrkB family protein [Pacificimonas sp.]|jgi:membrane protein|nr:YihY/virulence factor BrkB family protein [Pacificimonas sp.]
MRVLGGTFEDGLTQAGNLAFLSMLTLFPFFVIIGAIAGALGQSLDTLRVIRTFLQTTPPRVADYLAEPIAALLRESSGGLITFSLIVALWTAASYVETIRLILYKAYGFTAVRPIWQRRLLSFGIIIGSVTLMIVAFALQFVLVGVQEFLLQVLPALDTTILTGLRIGPMLALFGALYLLFTSLTPREYRKRYPKWPGAAATAAIWIGASNLLPLFITNFSNTDRFYGPLAGVIVTLIFFYIVGLAFIVGAYLNAALALGGDRKLDTGGRTEREREATEDALKGAE